MNGNGVMLVMFAVVTVFAALALWRVATRLREFEAERRRPDQSVLLLQQEIETAREEARRAQVDTLASVRQAQSETLASVRQTESETLGSVRQELHHFSAQMAAQMGQVNTGVQQQLQHVSQVVGAVQGSLGKLGEVTQRVFDIGRDIAGLEQILRSPKVRGGLGETFLEGLLSQMLPREHYDLQYAFATGDRVDAVVRIGGRLVPVDAKFPLENFRRMLEETEEERRRPLRRAFARDVKARVDEIAKRYILPDEGTFDFALMYIPAENVYYEIIVKDDGQEADSPATYAMGRHVIPVSPNSLYAYLQVIVLGLRGLSIEKDAREIQARLARLRGDIDKFRDVFDVMGKHLGNARNKYEDAAVALDRVEAKLEGIEATRDQPTLPGIA
jgi:DNA recombination protein RmuC